MKRLKQNFQKLAAALALMVLSFSAWSGHAAAASGSLSLSPASQNVTAGSNLVITVVANTAGSTILTMQASVTYSTAYFSSVDVANASGSPFDTNIQPDSKTAGRVTMARYVGNPSASSYSGAVFVLTFHTTGAVGTSSIDISAPCPTTSSTSNCSYFADGGGHTNQLASVGSGSFTVTAVPPSGGGGTPSGGTTTGTTTKTTTKRKITTPPAAPAASTTPTPAPKTQATPTPSDNTPKSRDVTITIVDQHGHPVSGAEVSIDNKSGKTDKNGRLTLYDVSPFNRHGTVTYGAQKQDVALEVDGDGQLKAASTFTIKVKTTSYLKAGSFALLVLVVIGAIAFIGSGRAPWISGLMKRKPKPISPLPFKPAPSKAARAVATPEPEKPSTEQKPPAKPLPTPAPAPPPKPAEVKAPTPPAPEPSPEKPDTASEREKAMEPGTVIHPSSGKIVM